MVFVPDFTALVNVGGAIATVGSLWMPWCALS